MKVSVFLEHLYSLSAQKSCTITAAMREAKRSGIDYVETDVKYIFGHEADFKRQLETTGLQVGGVYDFFDFGHQPQRDRALRLLDAAQAVGAVNVMAIPGFAEEGDNREAVRDKMAWELSELCADAAQRGIRVVLEDFDSEKAPYGRAEEVAWFLDRIPQLGCAFDTGNFLYHGEDVLKAYDLLEKRIAHVHMKDRGFSPLCGEKAVVSVTGKKLYPAPVGSGELPMAEIVRRLFERGYDGLFAMEHFGANDQLLYMRRSARWLKNIFR